MSHIELAGVAKRFHLPGSAVVALDGIDLIVPRGGFTSIVGTSGCGKSTLLRILAGLESQSAGRVSLDGQPISGPGRDRGMVFQEHRLLPWLNVEQNVAFALTGLHADEVRDRVAHHLDLVGLSGFAKAHPLLWAGGRAQRVAFARALVLKP